MNYKINEIGLVVKGEWLQQVTDDPVSYLLLDSRRVLFPAGSLFFALPGARRDGHLFIKDLYEKGVHNFIVSEPVATGEYPLGNFIRVKDTLQALQELAAWHRGKFSIPVVGITGSNGKTIVKEWLHQLLEEDYLIVRSPKSYNSQTGVPLSVWQLNETHQLALFEAGISRSEEMEKLERIIRPTIGIFTNIGEAHSEGFVNARQKVNEKLQLFKYAGVLIYSRDYPLLNEGIAAYLQQLGNDQEHPPFELFNWSTKTDASVRITAIQKGEAEAMPYATVTALFAGNEYTFTIPFTDDASVENAIICFCTLLYLKVDPAVIAKRMLHLANIPMRLELKKGINNCSVINDSYSSDLSSLRIALDFLRQLHRHTKRTVILSDILQSGRSENELYEEVAGILAHQQIQRLIGIGPQISKRKHYFKNIAGLQTHFYPDTESFRKDFYNLEFSNENILLKGARIFHFEQLSQQLEQKVHQTVLEIDLNALVHNLKQYQTLLNPATRLMVMVKAFSYGSGSFEIANQLQFHKVDYLAVAYIDEGVELRKAGITLPILVMNADEESFDALLQFNLEPAIYSPHLLYAFNEFLDTRDSADYPIHIEIETGMNRSGFQMRDLDVLTRILPQSRFRVRSVFSHLVASEDPALDDFTRQQGRLLLQACGQIEKACGYPFLKHIANTSGISRHPGLQLDMVRLGIGLYGIDSDFSDNALVSGVGEAPVPTPGLSGAGHPGPGRRPGLQEVSTLKSTISQIRQIARGETVGYNRRGVALRDSVIATVRLGYADGYPRRLGNGTGKMWLKGQLAPVIGSVCMDMTMIDITDIPGLKEGDEVVIFGKQLPVSQVAAWAGTIPYEIMTGISQRVKRVYFEEA